MAEKIWVSNRIFYNFSECGVFDGETNFTTTISGCFSTDTTDSSWLRAYEIWEHARQLIYSPVNEFSLADGITNLKRSMNSRLQLIEEIYMFKKVGYPNQPKGYLEKLETYGLVRPFIMKELLKIRNDIEHNDVEPPKVDRCKELVDVIWYFLKSTDSIVKTVYDDAEFSIYDQEDKEVGWGGISFSWNEYCNFQVRGVFPKEWISEREQENFIEIEKIEEKDLCKTNEQNQNVIKGKMILSKEDYRVLLETIFTHVYR